jgi:hypothetical protein
MSAGRLPTYIGIGAARCGSTSIHRYLGEHPEVRASPIKETNYFFYEGQRQKQFRIRSLAAYRAQFAGPEPAAGEFSPNYMNNFLASARIRAAVPHARLIVSLRDPTERAFSHWAHNVRTGRESRAAAEALVPGERYVEASFYSERLQPYLRRFPREQILIVLFESFRAEPRAVMSRIYEHVGVDPSFSPALEHSHNAAAFPRHPQLNEIWHRIRRVQPYWFTAPKPLIRLNARALERTHTEPPRLDEALRARLDAFYAEEIDRTEELVGLDLTRWRTRAPALA